MVGMAKGSTVAVAVLVFIGLFFSVAAIVTFAQAALFVSKAMRAEAIFIGSVARSGGNSGGTFFYPRLRFTTDRGQVITMTSDDGSTDQAYEDGAKVPVLYDPERQNMPSSTHSWSGSHLCALLRSR
jgi:hypothetical protein